MSVASIFKKQNAPSFKSTLIFYFATFIVIPMIIIVAAFYNLFVANNLHNFRESLTSNLNSVEDSTLQFFDQINNTAKILLDSSEVQSMFRKKTNNTPLSSSGVVTLNTLLQNYSIVSYNETVPLNPYIYLINNPEYYKFRSSNVRNIQEISNEDWYRKLPTNFDYKIVNTDDNDLIFVKRLYHYNGGDLSLEGLLAIHVERSYYENLLMRYKPDSLACLTLFDHDNQIIAQLGNKMLPQRELQELLSLTSQSTLVQKGNTVLGGAKIQELNWKTLYFVPANEMNLPIVNFSKLILPLILICLATAILLANLLSDHIAQPIKHLVSSMKNVGMQGTFKPLVYKRRDEFQYLINQYNKMVARLDDLITQLHQTEQRKKEAELASLQAQINPHFLYNTLDSITMLAMWNRHDDIIEVVTSLSDFFRYSLNKGKFIISVCDEIKQLTSYLKIQKLHYEDLLNYEINIENRINNFKTIKLILQPIVENSIKHGIAPLQQSGTVYIKGYADGDDIIFTVSDTGVGADINELNRLLTSSAEDNRSYGIRNVNWRIQNYFGSDYGLFYTNNIGGGVTCTVKIKAVHIGDASKQGGQ